MKLFKSETKIAEVNRKGFILSFAFTLPVKKGT